MVAIDVSDVESAKKLIKTLYPRVKFFKIGLELINTGKAPELVNFIHGLGARVFYDIKLNDIPNTVGKAVKVISGFGVEMLTIHASSGSDAIRSAVKNRGQSKIIGVTVLTSLKERDCRNIFGNTSLKKVIQFADMLLKNGADGMVCSVVEARIIRKLKRFKNFMIITPGIRPAWAENNDQERMATPREAILAGADYLVIGRPIIKPPQSIGSSIRAVQLVIEEIEKVMR